MLDRVVTRRRFVQGVALAASAAAVASSGGSSEASSTGKTTITIWDHDSDAVTIKAMDRIMRAYQTVHPNITLNLVHNQDTTKTLTAIAANAGPDVVWLWDDDDPLGSWAEAGAVIPLDNLIHESGYNIGQLLPGSVSTVTYKGKVYGLPFVGDVFWLWWNKADFRKVGLDPETPPRTISQLWTFARKLTRVSGNRIQRLGMLPPNANLQYYEAWAFAFGVDFYDPKTHRLLLDQPDFISAMENLVTNGYREFGSVRTSTFVQGLAANDSPNNAFLADQVSMQIEGDWFFHYIRDSKPGWHFPRDFGAAAVPWADGKQKPGGIPGALFTAPLVITRNAKDPKAAWQFIQWLQSAKISGQVGGWLVNPPMIKGGLSNPQLETVTGYKPLLAELRASHNVKAIPALAAKAELADQFEAQMAQAAAGKKSVAAAMQAVVAQVQPDIDKQFTGR